MDFALEALAQVKREAEPLLQQHYEEIALNKDKIKLNPDWRAYAELDKINALRVFTARKDGKLMGYFVVIFGYNGFSVPSEHGSVITLLTQNQVPVLFLADCRGVS